MWLKAKRWFHLLSLYLFSGMKAADKMILSNDEDKTVEIGGVEETQEVKSVLNDLLKGELTQEVIELRHEMYFAERESKKYRYVGNGNVVKKNGIFGYSGNIDVRDGLPLLLVQDNKKIVKGLESEGIHFIGKKGYVVDEGSLVGDFKADVEYTIKIERDFIPSYPIEKYVNRIVLKSMDDEGGVLVDLYIPSVKDRFENVQKMFINQMEKILKGDNRKNQILEFDTLSFISSAAYGVDDYVTFKLGNFKYEETLMFDGSYIVRYTAKILERSDLLDEIYDETTARKCENHEKREGSAMISADTVLSSLQGEQYDYDSAKELMNKVRKKKEETNEKE